jgi:hypothetical protein
MSVIMTIKLLPLAIGSPFLELWELWHTAMVTVIS